MTKHNPFRIFRKNQKAWLAGLTLFTMFSFIALGSMFQCLEVGSRGGQGSVLATTKTLGNYDYNAMLGQQDEVNRLYTFLQAATSSMAEDKLVASQGNLLFTFEGNSDKPEEQMPIILDQLMNLFNQLSSQLNASQDLVNRWLVIQTGRKAGLNPPENSVRDYLAQLFFGKLNSKHLAQGLSAAGLNQEGLVILLKNQLIQDWMFRKADGGWRTDPMTAMMAMPTGHGTIPSVPAAKAETVERLYRSLKADAAVFPVENYFEQVGNPTEEEAKAYFEKYKNSPWSAASATPGFFLPTKAAFEAVNAELTEERLAAVTDEEIAAYYEEHKESFAKPTKPAADAPAPAIEGSEDFLPTDLESTDVTGPSDAETPAEEAPADAPAEEPKDAETESGEEAPAETSALNNASLFRLVSEEAEQEENAQPAEEAKSEENAEPAEEAAPEENAQPAEEAKSEENAESAEEAAPEENAQPAEEAKPEENAEPAEEAAPEENAQPAEEAASEENAEPEYFTLDEVKESIRRQLATEKLTKELEEIQTKMEDYAKILANKRANVSANVELPDFDLKKIAEEKGLSYYQTSITDEEGNAVPAMLDQNEAALSRALPPQALYEIYNSSLMDYSPQITPLAENKIYLYWVTESKGEHTPEFDEEGVAKLVNATWKKERAIKLAEQDAQDLMKRAETESKTLEELAKDDGDAAKYVFVKTEPFTQYVLPRSFRSPSLSFGEVREEGVKEGDSQIENRGLTMVSDDFFDAAYRLDKGGIAVADNAPKDRAIVLQITERDDDASLADKLGDESLDAGAVQTIRVIQNLKFQDAWLDQLKKDAGFEWKSIPGRMR